MRIAIMTMALRVPAEKSRWITVPPQGYAGIHWVVSHLIDGLLDRDHHVFLLGAPGSDTGHPNLTVAPIGEPDDVHAWLSGAPVDLVHDHSCGQLDLRSLPDGLPYLSTHHLTGRGSYPETCVYLSYAQRNAANGGNAPVVRIPVNESRYRYRSNKDEYLLFLGRISTFKGAYEAAAFAHAAGRRLVLAGPSWEEEYLREILRDFGSTVEVVGEIGGDRRLDLLGGASALLVTSQSCMGPWGTTWCEPGATVVSEAAASGTPVIATPNGCLAEIVPPVGAIIPEGRTFTSNHARSVLAGLPAPDRVFSEATARWDYREIARQYEDIYKIVLGGGSW